MPVRRSTRARARRHRVYGRRGRRSTCASARARTCARSPTRSAGTAGRCGAPRSGRSRSTDAVAPRRASCRSTPAAAEADVLDARRAVRRRDRRARGRRSSSRRRARGRDRHVRRRPPRAPAGDRGGASRRGWRRRSSRSTRTRARPRHTASSCSRRSSGGSSCSRGSASTDARRALRRRARSARAGGLRRDDPAGDRRRGRRGGRRASGSAAGVAATSTLLERLGFDVRARAARRGRVVDRRSASCSHEGDVGRGRGCSARPPEVEGIVVARRPARRHARLPDREPRRRRRTCSCPRSASTPARRSGTGGDLDRHESALRRRRSGGSRRSCSTSTATSTGSGSSSSSGSGSATRRRSGPRRSWSSRSRATSRRRGPPSGRLIRERRASAQVFARTGVSSYGGNCSTSSCRSAVLESVRCLECGEVYSKPVAGGTVRKNPGCPDLRLRRLDPGQPAGASVERRAAPARIGGRSRCVRPR